MQSGFIWLKTGTSGCPCEYHYEHTGCIILGEIVVHLRKYQVVKTHLLKDAHQNISKIVILGLAPTHRANTVLCTSSYVQNVIRFQFSVQFMYCEERRVEAT